MYTEVKYLPFGDKALVVEFGNAISPEISEKVRGLSLAIAKEKIAGLISCNPTYRSLILEYSPLQLRYQQLADIVKGLEQNLSSMELPSPNLFQVPTLYGGDFGPDIGNVMELNSLTQQEVIDIHTGTDYLVYMMGFTPGFSYLGGMDPRIETPRLATPRTKISGGSVGIAGKQTGFYSIDSPGGWQLIGHTPIRIYDPYREKPILHSTGDYIRFVSVTKDEYDEIKRQVDDGSYKYKISPMEGGKS